MSGIPDFLLASTATRCQGLTLLRFPDIFYITWCFSTFAWLVVLLPGSQSLLTTNSPFIFYYSVRKCHGTKQIDLVLLSRCPGKPGGTFRYWTNCGVTFAGQRQGDTRGIKHWCEYKILPTSTHKIDHDLTTIYKLQYNLRSSTCALPFEDSCHPSPKSWKKSSLGA